MVFGFVDLHELDEGFEVELLVFGEFAAGHQAVDHFDGVVVVGVVEEGLGRHFGDEVGVGSREGFEGVFGGGHGFIPSIGRRRIEGGSRRRGR